MTLVRGSNGLVHSIFATTSTEHMSDCGVFYKKHKEVNAGVVTCLRCASRPAAIYTEIEVNDHG